MDEVFRAAVERGASDIHIKAEDVVRARIDGRLAPLTRERVGAEQVRRLAGRILPSQDGREHLDRITDQDCAWELPGTGRFRATILRQQGGFMVVLRVIPSRVPTLEELRLPGVLERIALHDRGLVLVTGVAGSGKSSTMAAIVDHMNRTDSRHVVTLENPVEFVHEEGRSSVTQRDVGTDTSSFTRGLRAALRQDPDVIVIGEMRDAETIDTCLKAAETGHLVISSLHTRGALRTVSRIVAYFPRGDQEVVRLRLSETLRACVSQQLLLRAGGRGRIVAAEVMVVTGTIQDCLRRPERLHEIADLMEEGREHYGSQSFDQHLTELVHGGLVDFDVAKAASPNPSDFELKMNLLGDGPAGEAGARSPPPSG